LHPVLILTRNNLALTKGAVQSVIEQSIFPTYLYFFDNGSTDGTREWIEGTWTLFAEGENAGVSHGWNVLLDHVFGEGYEHALVINNDVILPEWFYAELLSYNEPFVTGIAVDDMEAIKHPAERMPLTPNPDFSAFLIRREAWEKIGPFNEKMMLYAGDADYHVRGHRLGVGMWKANVPYYHERSSTMNNASPRDRAVIQAQAEADRGQFRALYGVIPGEKGYDELFR
jgi:GT2 family glycosyltransferase